MTFHCCSQHQGEEFLYTRLFNASDVLGSENRDLYTAPLFINTTDFHQACINLSMGESLAAANATANEAKQEIYRLQQKLHELHQVAVEALEKALKT